MLIKYIGVQYYLLYKDDASTIEEKLFDHDVSTHMPHKFMVLSLKSRMEHITPEKNMGGFHKYTASKTRLEKKVRKFSDFLFNRL